MKLLVQYGVYHCATCHECVRFEPAEDSDWPGSGTQLRKDGTAIGECVNNRCAEFGKRFKITLPTIEVELLS